MELLQLKYFCDSAKTQNFSKTAENFTVPPSNISQSIKRLEKELSDIKNNPSKNIVESEEELSKTLSDGILLTKNTKETIDKVEKERISVIKEKLINNINEQIRLLEELDKK